ncbi:hypothetical protein [Vibrio parahaemolyticus]|uniref:hypothetical protein n=1 Tax=Vibrio parahaemolyticus TaxID=670 RepID=UPI001E45C395|nr:hypothetical protein [Vibrio parahaemolyticus]
MRYIAIGADTHKIIAAKLSLSNATYAEMQAKSSRKHAESSMKYQIMELMALRPVPKLAV